MSAEGRALRRRRGGAGGRTPGRWRSAFTRMAGLLLGLGLLIVAGVGLLRFVPPPTTAFMLGDPGPEPLQQRWVALADLPPHLPLAFIAAEDQRFLHHWGLDLTAIQAAMDDHRRGGRLRGASTLSQQVARNLFLWRQRSWLRKGLELPLTLMIEVLWPKRRILEVYLNIAELGPGVYGVDAAARHHWGVSARALTPRQAALLAAILPAPRRYAPAPPSPYVSERADWIERQMVQLGQTALPR